MDIVRKHPQNTSPRKPRPIFSSRTQRRSAPSLQHTELHNVSGITIGPSGVRMPDKMAPQAPVARKQFRQPQNLERNQAPIKQGSIHFDTKKEDALEAVPIRHESEKISLRQNHSLHQRPAREEGFVQDFAEEQKSHFANPPAEVGVSEYMNVPPRSIYTQQPQESHSNFEKEESFSEEFFEKPVQNEHYIRRTKKQILLFGGGFFVICALGLGGFFLWQTYGDAFGQEQPSLETDADDFQQIVQDISQTEDVSSEEVMEESTQWKSLSNSTYKYALKYQDDISVDTQDMNDTFESIVIDETALERGGSILFSNYADVRSIDPTDPSTHPEGFYVIGMIVYRLEDATIQDMAAILGVETDVDKIAPFVAKNTTGTQFVAPGMDDQNPRIATIFQEDDLFYVFQLSFVNGNIDIVRKMDLMMKTFEVR